MSTTTSNPPQVSPDLGRSGVWMGGASHRTPLDDVELVSTHASAGERPLPEPLRRFERFGSVDIRFVGDEGPADDTSGMYGDDDTPPSPVLSRRLFSHIHAQLEQLAKTRPAGRAEEPHDVWSYRERDVVELDALSSFAAGLGEEEPTERRRLLLLHLASMDSSRGTHSPAQPDRAVEESFSIDPNSGVDDLYPPFLGMLAKAAPNLKGRKVAVLVSSGTPAELLEALERQLVRAGARMATVAPRSARIRDDRGHLVPVNYELSATPSVLFDAVAILTTHDGAEELARDRGARAWVFNAFQHCRVVGYSAGAAPLLLRSGIDDLGGLMLLTGERDASLFVKLAVASRSWERDGSADPLRAAAKREVPAPPPSNPAGWAS